MAAQELELRLPVKADGIVTISGPFNKSPVPHILGRKERVSSYYLCPVCCNEIAVKRQTPQNSCTDSSLCVHFHSQSLLLTSPLTSSLLSAFSFPHSLSQLPDSLISCPSAGNPIDIVSATVHLCDAGGRQGIRTQRRIGSWDRRSRMRAALAIQPRAAGIGWTA